MAYSKCLRQHAVLVLSTQNKHLHPQQLNQHSNVGICCDAVMVDFLENGDIMHDGLTYEDHPHGDAAHACGLITPKM
jgi:hypothetical protein